MIETLQKYKGYLDAAKKHHEEVKAASRNPREVALAAELLRLASDCYQMAVEDGLQ